MSPQFRTIAQELRFEPEKTKGSRFIATAAPAQDEDEVEALLARVRKEFHDARHTCYAWRLGQERESFRFQDDGEPTGSAGRPILQQIEGRELVDVVVAVTRYFGGTKLGVGGLMRAYGGAAGDVLDQAEIRTITITRRIWIEHPYECSGAVQGLLAATEYVPVESDYGERVRFALDLPVEEVEAFVRELTERTASLARVT